MLKYYVINSIRNLKRNLRFSVINITGLSLTMVLVIMLFSWLNFEFSFDRFHKNARRIYRIYEITTGESIDKFAGTPAPLGESIKKEIPEVGWIPADQDFVSTLKIEMTMGESLAENNEKGTRGYILNESAVKMIGWEDPLGKKIDIAGEGIVTGVVKDFNFKSLRTEIEPVALTSYPPLYDNMLIRISSGKISETLDFLRAEWKELFGETIFEYSFLDEDFRKMYEKDTVIMTIITVVSVLSLFISCIGLLGLVIFTTDSKTKEIGIRKVAGSTSLEILAMLSIEFILWILIALTLSIPVIITFMHRWLEDFAYSIRIGWWFFVLTGILAIIFSLITVSWHTLYIARKNPVDCLRHE